MEPINTIFISGSISIPGGTTEDDFAELFFGFLESHSMYFTGTTEGSNELPDEDEVVADQD